MISIRDCLRRATLQPYRGAFLRQERETPPIYQQTSIGLPALGSNRNTINPIQVPQFTPISPLRLRAQQVLPECNLSHETRSENALRPLRPGNPPVGSQADGAFGADPRQFASN